MAKKLIGIGGGVIVVLIAISFIIYRFSNPHLTETELFLNRWPLVLIAIAGIIVFKVYYE